MAKPGVMFYFNMRPFSKLSDSERLRLYDAILDYSQTGEVPELSGALGVVWDYIQPTLDGEKLGVKGAFSSLQSGRKKDIMGEKARPFPALGKGTDSEARSFLYGKTDTGGDYAGLYGPADAQAPG